jgi:hypothetical protein
MLFAKPAIVSSLLDAAKGRAAKCAMVQVTHRVMPGLTRHPEALCDPGYRGFEGKRCHWMPGQARHDGMLGKVCKTFPVSPRPPVGCSTRRILQNVPSVYAVDSAGG